MVINEDHDDNHLPFDRILKIYDPSVVEPVPEFTRIVEEQVYEEDDRWWHLATGDLDSDGRDEIVVVTYPNGSWRSYFYVYDPWPGDDTYPCGGFDEKNYYVDDGFANQKNPVIGDAIDKTEQLLQPAVAVLAVEKRAQLGRMHV